MSSTRSTTTPPFEFGDCSFYYSYLFSYCFFFYFSCCVFCSCSCF